MDRDINRVTAGSLLIALGIIFGDIGTSPLYVLNAIASGRVISELLVVGSLSCIIWTLTIQTTIKYVWLTLKADNKGEGGIFSLYTLVRRRRHWLVFPAMIGGAALLADGMITPPISVTSAIEGLRQIPAFSGIQQHTIVIVVIGILVILFFLQQFGSDSIGKLFGPIMFLWFAMIAVLGASHLIDDLQIFKALNPYYAVQLLTVYPRGFWMLGAVFLCTTGAEALYSDLGHVGRKNIRVSWIYVKICLLLNYLGQGAWLLHNHLNATLDTSRNSVFYSIMPAWFLIPGIVIATAAAIIASQALISGSFTLISESMRLNLWPKLRVSYPTEQKGQLYIPAVNFLLFGGCCGITLYFRSSSHMEAAYGLAITLCMLATSVLFANYLVIKRTPAWVIYLYLLVYFSIEGSFLFANLEKFPHGGFVTLIVAGLLFSVMYIWYRSRRVRNRYIEFVRMEDYLPQIQELSMDKMIPKFTTHLMFMTSSPNSKEIEHKIVHSILGRKPKRADIFWFIHIDTLDEPYTSEYYVDHIIPNEIIRVEFRLGFRIEPRINLLMRRVVEDLVKNREVNIISRYASQEKNAVVGDYQVVVMEKYLSDDNELPVFERLVMKIYFWIKEISVSEERGFGLDPSNVIVEKFPLVVSPVSHLNMKRV